MSRAAQAAALGALSVLACADEPGTPTDGGSDGGVHTDAPGLDAPATDGTTRSDAARLDAMLPPIGADEPVYVEGMSTTLFYDSFESYADAAALLTGAGDYTYITNAGGLDGISIATAGAAVGAQNVLMDYQGAGEYSRLLETNDVDETTSNVVVVSFMYRNTGVWYEGKVWIALIEDYAGRLLLHAATEPILSPSGLETCFYSGDEPLRPDIPPPFSPSFVWNRDPLDHHYAQNMAWDEFQLERDINDGSWHRLTTQFRREVAGPETGTGRLEMWVDGLKVTEYVGDDPTRCEYEKIRITTDQLVDAFQFPGPSSFRWPGGADMEYDEIRIFVP